MARSSRAAEASPGTSAACAAIPAARAWEQLRFRAMSSDCRDHYGDGSGLTMPATWPAHAPPAFHVLAKPSGAICNLDCEYCFFLSKELLYPGDRFRMAEDLLETYLRQTIESHRVDEITIAWQGGEPTLMGLDFFRRSVEIAHSHLPAGKSLQFTMQTNGTLLDDTWCEFLAEHDFLVGLSIDGPPAMHDAYRVD